MTGGLTTGHFFLRFFLLYLRESECGETGRGGGEGGVGEGEKESQGGSLFTVEPMRGLIPQP